MAENKCTGDCLRCTFQQQVYCAAQRTYALLENQRAIVERLDRMDARLAETSSVPLIKIAHQGDGAENRPPETT